MSGETIFTFPEYNALDLIISPQGATNYRFVASATEIDFLNSTYNTKTTYSDHFIYDENVVPTFSLQNDLTPNSTNTIALAIGIEFFQEVNSVLYPLKNGNYNCANLYDIQLP